MAEGDQVDGMDLVLDMADGFDGQDVETECCLSLSKSKTVRHIPEMSRVYNLQRY